MRMLDAGALDCAATDVTRTTGRRSAAPRVLVVDDNRDSVELFAHALEATGYDVRVAFDGPEALGVAAGFRPEIALIDIGLPVMDGYDLALRLREVPGLRDLKLVAITGYGRGSDLRRSRQAGFQGHLVKPVDLGQMDALLGTLIGAPPPPSPSSGGAADVPAS